YGVDSILGVGFVQALNDRLGLALNTTILFDHTSVARLARHIEREHGAALAAPLVSEIVSPLVAPGVAPAASPAPREAVAVIGMSGQFPGAASVAELWRNLAAGVDPIVALGPDYLSPARFSEAKEAGKSYARFGGALATRACFDPLFFGISPREAESMNPHQRLILQEGWRALEDAGIDPKSLAETRAGIFVGCEPSAYVHESFTGASDAIAASRLSYFLNLRGPAFVVNTGCSSSGVALHLACESLRNGESDLALAGGAFAVMGETILVGLSQTDMLSRSGRCRSFDAAADGMAMSEGVGMVALKRLSDALRDGDPIHGVIRASGLNQDGASNGITAPSGAAQSALIEEVYRRFDIDPERISYVEAHGTGTKLGDPVEANALTQAFRRFTERTGFCALGSSKSHLGHTSAAAGVIGLIAVLLAMKHARLPGLQHFERLNPLIDLSRSAFYPLTTSAPWRAAPGVPRMAALNSFGHSGTNVHLVVEEIAPAQGLDTGAPQLILLSAKDEDRLAEVAANLEGFLDDSAASLADIAHTLQLGRTPLEARAAFVAADMAELRATLAELARGERVKGRADGRVVTGYVEPRRRKPAPPEAAQWLEDGALHELARAFVGGAQIDWRGLRRTGAPRRIHLPTYPFARDRYWKPATSAAPVTQTPQLHPLLHRNASTLSCMAFQSHFSGTEFFLADHVIGGRRILPAAAFLEMTRAAACALRDEETGAGRPLTLANVIWTAPLVVEGDVDVTLAVERQADGAFACALSRDGATLHQARVLSTPPAPAARLDLDALRARFSAYPDTAPACLAALRASGAVHGPSLLALTCVRATPKAALAELLLPEAAGETQADFALHPSLLDAAFQASVSIALARGDESGALTPFALDALEVHGPLEARMWAMIRFENDRLDIDIATGAGEIRARARGLRSRAARRQDAAPRCDAATPPERVLRFQGDEYFLADHSAMLPAAVFLDIAVTAVRDAGLEPAALSQIVFPRPLRVTPGAALTLRLSEAETGLAFTLTGAEGLHCQGRASAANAEPTDIPDIASIRARLTERLDRAQCDALLQGTHGPRLMCVSALDWSADEAVALIELPDALRAEDAAQPCLLNGALLAGALWRLACRDDGALPMPFALEALRLDRPLPSRFHAHVLMTGATANAGAPETVDIALYDVGGERLGEMAGLSFVFQGPADDLVFAAPCWEASPILPGSARPVAAGTVFALAGAPAALGDALRARWPEAETLELPHDFEQAFDALLPRCREADLSTLLLILPDDAEAWRFEGLAGVLKTLALERHGVVARMLRHALAQADDIAHCVARIGEEIASADGETEIRYVADGREARRLTETRLTEPAAPVIAPGDVVWITGGLGGVGRAIAQGLAERGARVALTGRSEADDAQRRFIAALGALHVRADVGDPAQAARAVAEILAHFGRLHHVIHAAGIVADARLAGKRQEDARRVLAPKVAGARALDAATRNLPLKSFSLAASIAGVLGNIGQADYAAANAFLDAFARWRGAARAGRTVSIDWPLWRDGGMTMAPANQELMRRATGMTAMDARAGLRALDLALAAAAPQILVAFGNPSHIRAGLLAFRHASPQQEQQQSTPDRDGALIRATRAELARIVAQVQRIPLQKISLDRDLSDFGFDSISFTELANALNRAYGLTLMPTLFFEIPDLAALAELLVMRHRAAIEARHGDALETAAPASERHAPAPVSHIGHSAQTDTQGTARDDAIAIIGMGGMFPGADDLDELWARLDAGADLVGEAPATRWDWRSARNASGAAATRWGGFVAGAECFDAAFFGVPRVEAEAMDPQLRLFLQAVWTTLEDAAIAPSALAGGRVGVFAGAATADYKELVTRAKAAGVLPAGAEPFPFMIANRTSFWFNFNGPSETVDTACSSSLVAVNRAVESLRAGSCDVALAGGVNVICGPRLTLASSDAGLLSPDGRCMTFDARANGYVRSEGVALVMLKPLRRAVADGDRIHGVIIGSGENHGGRAASPTAPNAAAQRRLIAEVYRRAGVDPRGVTYVEAHGTG
ncbi:MAG: SDR family oxidoreductase, partial [Alphaproteobacteria bacterium]|nr:SDR family oxidoreductase [Alphaproteobacteria bacterium]